MHTKMEQPPVKRNLTPDEIEDILSGINYPFNIYKKVRDNITNQLRNNIRPELEKALVLPKAIPLIKIAVAKSFNKSLISPEAPIGNNAADAVGQQATQSNLNTFHHVGSDKTGGTDGIKEALGLVNRKSVYTIIHFNNKCMTFEDVIKLKNVFLGVDINYLTETKEITYVDINKIIKNPNFFWYTVFDVSNLFQRDLDIIFPDFPSNISMFDRFQHMKTFINNNKKLYTGDTIRSVYRIRFNVQKLYEHNITLHQIAKKIESGKIKIDKTEYGLKCIYSPTNFGVLDIYINSNDASKDNYIVNAFQYKDFDKINISGIPEITNFYAVNKTLTKLIRDGETIDGKLHCYINFNRFECIPFFRLAKLIEIAGYEISPETYKIHDKYNLFQYNSLKLVEYRYEILLKVVNYGYKLSSKFNKTFDFETGQVDGNYIFIKLYPKLAYINSSYFCDDIDTVINSELTYYHNNVPYLPTIISDKRYDIQNFFIVNTSDSYEDFIKNISQPIQKHIINITTENEKTLIEHNIPDIIYDIFKVPTINGVSTVKMPKDQINGIISKYEEKKYLKYYYAETTGGKLQKILQNPLVDKPRCWSNQYREINEIYGIDTLKNFLFYDLIAMINNSGYIDMSHIDILTSTLTHTGLNPMTSEGITAHGSSSLSIATFDRVAQHLIKAATSGKTEPVAGCTSVEIMLGSKFSFGTNGSKCLPMSDKIFVKSPPKTRQETKYDINIKIDNFETTKSNMESGVVTSNIDTEILTKIPIMKSNQIPSLNFWVINNILIKDVRYYLSEPEQKTKEPSLITIMQFKKALNMAKKIRII